LEWQASNFVIFHKASTKDCERDGEVEYGLMDGAGVLDVLLAVAHLDGTNMADGTKTQGQPIFQIN
jgi:hypothetical protein